MIVVIKLKIYILLFNLSKPSNNLFIHLIHNGLWNHVFVQLQALNKHMN